MKIHSLTTIIEGDRVKVAARVTCSDGDALLWYSVDRVYQDFLETERLDAFLVGLLSFAMARNEDIYIAGAISEKLFYSLTHSLIKILSLLHPSSHQIKIFPSTLMSAQSRPKSTGVATGFSGGVDSFCVLADHFYQVTSESYRITHLVFNNVGSHGLGGRQLFWQRYDRLLGFAQAHQLPFVSIDSNLDEIVNLDFRHTHTSRNISAILVLQPLFRKFLYASAHKYENCFIGPSEDASVIDPVGIHLFSTENTEFISTGCEYSRVEKTEKVADLEDSYQYLDVCVDALEQAHNCSTCWKCARTLLTLEILGKQAHYSQVFDIDKFQRVREDYIQSILTEKKPLEQEVIDLARARQYPLIPGFK